MPFFTQSSSHQNQPSPAKRIDWAGLGWLYLFFWYFSGVTQALLIPSSGFTGSRCVLFMSFMWLAPVLLFPRFTKQISIVVGIVLWVVSIIALGYWSIYGTEFSQSVFFTIFETNTVEAKEYLSQYIKISLILGIIVYSVIALLIWKRLRPVYLPRPYAIGVAVAVLGLNLGAPYLDVVIGNKSFGSATNKLFRRMEPATPWQFLMSYLQYQRQTKRVRHFLASNATMPPLENLADSNANTPRTLVLVIGESTTSQRMSLYGYPRKTTPQLDALKAQGNLIVFNDVISPRPYTIEVLRQVLSFANQKEPERYLTEPNLMNLMKQAGYKTFWVTNQQTISSRNVLLTAFSQQADETTYLNQSRAQNATQPDSVVFEPFTEMLADAAPKKFIVIHLLGTHSRYDLRYPDEYNQFTGRDNVPANLSDGEADTFNSYDNAVLYNDFVVSRLIDIFSKTNSNGFLLYFSDHGEDVFHTPPHTILGRDEAKPTRDMFAVPFIVWMSPEWKKTHPADLSPMLNRPYSIDYFIHTWSELADLRYNLFQPELSLVSTEYKPQTRWIGDPTTGHSLRDFDAIVTAKPARH